MSERSLLEDTNATKLLAKKSSYQAWKCVSFGCSLLALLLLLSKWQEISTDLQLMLNIENLIWQRQVDNGNSNNNTGSGNIEASDQMSWPPPTIEPLDDESSLNETILVGHIDNHNSTQQQQQQQSLVVSHMHISINRELQSNQLLKKEVETFIAEFRGAKSTISLSSLLVSVYIISWILMTLAINDARISNDISLRNILLLSVFGAIDMAASFGFVLVRLIMYSVKNYSSRGEMIASAGLRNAPIRMAPDQVAAFTAFRLIAMRSCSAYMDIFVSFIVVLLTILRLYAILQALAYYRHLRRSFPGARAHNNGSLELPRSGPPAQHWSSRGETPPMQGSKHIWSTMYHSNHPSTAHQQEAAYGYDLAAAQQAAMMISSQQQQQQHMPHSRYSFHHLAGTNESPPTGRSRASWRQQKPTRPAPPQRQAPGELVLVNKRQVGRMSRSPSPVFRPKIQFQKRQRTITRQGGEEEQETAELKLIKSPRQQQQQQKNSTNTLRTSDGTTYTLLSADQMERISRKLVEAKTQDSNNNNNNTHKSINKNRKASQRINNQKVRPKQRNNFELLMMEADEAVAQSTASSLLAEGGEEEEEEEEEEDDNDNDSDLSTRAGGSTGGDGNRAGRQTPLQAARLLSVSSLRQVDANTTAGYLIEEPASKKRQGGNERNSIHGLSSSAKNKLLLGEYFYA